MMWLYVMLVAIVAGAVPTTVWLKRAGDREWQAHRIRVLSTPMTKAFIDFQVQIGDRVTPALQQMAREIDRMTAELGRALNSPAMQKIARDLNDLNRKGRA